MVRTYRTRDKDPVFLAYENCRDQPRGLPKCWEGPYPPCRFIPHTVATAVGLSLHWRCFTDSDVYPVTRWNVIQTVRLLYKRLYDSSAQRNDHLPADLVSTKGAYKIIAPRCSEGLLTRHVSVKSLFSRRKFRRISTWPSSAPEAKFRTAELSSVAISWLLVFWRIHCRSGWVASPIIRTVYASAWLTFKLNWNWKSTKLYLIVWSSRCGHRG